MPAQKLTNEIISAAIDGFEAQKLRIDGRIAELRAMLIGGSAPSPSPAGRTTRKKRTMSAAGRKAISEATKKRWAAFHAAKQAGTASQSEPNSKQVMAKAASAKRRGPAKKAVAKKSGRTAARASTEVAAQ